VKPEFKTKSFISIEKLKELLKYQCWDNIINEEDPSKAYDHFIGIIKNHMSKCTNYKRKSKYTMPLRPWITRGILNSIKHKDKLYRAVKRNPQNITILDKYKKYRNFLTKLLKTSKANYFQTKIIKSQGNLKQTWATINEALNKSAQTNDIDSIEINCDGTNKQIHDKFQISKIMNEYFTSLSSSITSHNCSDINKRGPDITFNEQTIYLSPITSAELQKIISSLKSKSSHGIDEISTKLIKEIAPYILTPLVHILNISLSSGIFPNALKIARVVPIFKSTNRLDPCNYRPISLLPSFSKLFEKAINTRIINFFEKHGLLYLNQHGFRKDFSTSTALIDVTNYIKENIDKGQSTIGVFVDLSKAFDSISHDILLEKLYKYGIRGTAHNIISSYLQNRCQYVDINGVTSTCLNLSKGVPQGSILGPTLFLIYVNDIYKCSTAHLTMYADDISLLYTGRNINDCINNVNKDLLDLDSWCRRNQLAINVNKTNLIIFHSPQRKIPDGISPIKINKQKLQLVHSTKFLGFILDQNLSWKQHVKHICKNITFGISYIIKVQSLFPRHILKILYRSFVECHLRYGIESWGSACKTTLSPIHTLQKRALRIMYHLPFRTSVYEIFSTIGLLTVYQIAFQQIAVMMHKTVYEKAQSTLNTIEYPNNALTRANSGKQLIIPKIKTDYGKRKTNYIGSKLWNNLDISVKALNSHTPFKKALKTYIICHDATIYTLLN